MKVLAIMGSPTGTAGHTYRTVAVLERQLAAAGAEVEYLHLHEADLGACEGDLRCVKEGSAACPFADDVTPVLRRMHDADAVVFASPVHNFNVSALMKNFFDLNVVQMHRPSFFGTPAAVVTTAAGAGQRGVLKYLARVVTTWGFEVEGRLGSHMGFFHEPVYQERLERAAEKLATKLVAAARDPQRRRPGIADLMNFRIWRSVVRRSREASPADWAHWEASGWNRASYYYPTRVNPVANLLAGLTERMIERSIRNVSSKPVT